MSKSLDTVELVQVNKDICLEDVNDDALSFDIGPNHAQGMPVMKPNRPLGRDEH